MRWFLATLVVFASSPPAFADEVLPSRPVNAGWILLAAPAPVSFDLIDLRAEQHASRTPPRSDTDPHSIFIVKQHLGVAGGYDNGSAHGSIGYYLTVAELGRWNFGVPSIEVGVGRYPTYDARLQQSFMKDEIAFFVSMASAHFRAGYIPAWGVHWYVNLEQVFDVHTNRVGSQLGISFSRK
jgi:hypothetical protein